MVLCRASFDCDRLSRNFDLRKHVTPAPELAKIQQGTLELNLFPQGGQRMNSILTAMMAFAALAVTVQGQETPPQPKITGVLVIITARKTTTVQKVMTVMPAEIRATVDLYLQGKITQWFSRGDGKGVVLLLNVATVDEARALVETMPLHKETLMDDEYIPVGPLLPLRMLMNGVN
jgi:hypothetical protein